VKLDRLLRPLREYAKVSASNGGSSPLSDVSRPTTPGPAETEISAITDDSREVAPGSLFVAIRGVELDGAKYIPDAIARGAVAVVGETDVFSAEFPKVLFITVPDARSALAHLAAAWHNHPSRNLRVIGVTGTDGKTTTCTLIENILLASGHTVGAVTTVGAHVGGQEIDTGFHTTTPDAPDIQNYLAQMVEKGTEYAIVEATSHGLAQHRLDAVDFDVAVVTNITHEHLDFHGTWENYRDAKALLFRALEDTRRKPRTAKVAVLNANDTERGVFDYLRAIPADERIIYSVQLPEGIGQDADGRGQEAEARRRSPDPKETWIYARDILHNADGLRFAADTPFGTLALTSPLIGRYNVSNILAAVGAGMARRIPFEGIKQGVAMTHGIIGRMERVHSPESPVRAAQVSVFVDFAHTPNALERALETVRELTRGRVIVVFGCAGLRDVQKRAWMGRIAGRLSDVTVVTAEDPRTESLELINAEIARGLEEAGRRRDKDYYVVNDRGEAIAFAINGIARPGDLVIVTGKGHERSMCYGTTELPWSDQFAVSKAIGQR
jgi:UDP-N-acetylmuramoyl-L-alanyl-D-glutamate--2,6-diaminopimelate ligase